MVIADKNMLSIKDKPLLLSLICTLFVAYPNAAWLWCELFWNSPVHTQSNEYYIILFLVRFVFFYIFVWLLLWCNLKKMPNASFTRRLTLNLGFVVAGLLVYMSLSELTGTVDMPTSLIIMQFLTSGIICAMLGYIFQFFEYQRSKEQEIEQLRIENLESRLSALTNQINPHFFFNSLNGVSALVRKGDDEKTLNYVNHLSDIFRYILQSEKKGLVTLREELNFVEAFCHVMKVRYGDKLNFDIKVPEDTQQLRLPVLSLLPLLENVVAHNMIDTQHPLTVNISMNSERELVIKNKVQPKLTPPQTNGTGLNNLQSRFQLLMGRSINVDDDGTYFTVWLPLAE